MYQIVKRALDVVLTILILVTVSPLMLAAALTILVCTGPPILFSQQRGGRDGRGFLIHKFRTMVEERGEGGAPLPEEARLTRLGRFLRSTSIDELPQLWNVLRGEMSLVGPRPLHVQYVGRYSSWHRRRMAVRPGITGWAQVNGRNGLGWPEKFDLDVWYVDHCSVLLDLKILLSTAIRVFHHTGINYRGNATMPEFMGIDGPPRES